MTVSLAGAAVGPAPEASGRVGGHEPATRAFGVYAVLALLALAIRVPLAWFNHVAGYETGDTQLINIDGIGYVRKAVGAQESFGDVNLLWETLNGWTYALFGSERFLYLQMSALNVGLALLLPLAAWPAFTHLVDDPAVRQRARLIATALLLFWPPAIWMSVQNMKDTLLALLLCAFTSAAVALVGGARRPLVAGAALVVTGGLIFSLRIYALALLLVALAAALVPQWRRRPQLVLAGAAVAVGALVGPLRGPISTFLAPENRFLFDPQVVEAINQQRLTQDEAFLEINFTPAAIARDALRAPLNPFPSLRWRTGYDGLLMLRTVAVALALGGFLWWLVRWTSPQRPFFLGLVLVAWAFFSVARAYSGPRQIYSTVEPPLLIAAATALATTPRIAYWGRSAAGGAIVLIILLVYTTLVDLGAS